MEPSDYEKVELYAKFFAESNRRVAMRDFARLNVYVADGNVLQTEEQEDYVTTQLLADIGGQLGLWVGVSVITLASSLLDTAKNPLPSLIVRIIPFRSSSFSLFHEALFTNKGRETYTAVL